MEFKASADEFFKLGDIGDYKSADDIIPIGSATIVAINFATILTRMGVIGGQSLNTYFDTFGLEGILANVSLIVIMFQVARWGYTSFYAKTHAWSPFVFVCLLIFVQLIHDLLFYYGAINLVPTGNNEMIDALKRYSKEHGPRALAAHAAFLIFVGAIAMFFKERSMIFTIIVVTITMYMLPYAITTFGPKPPAPIAVKAEQESQKPNPQKPTSQGFRGLY
jgi:hypothetical protein